MTKVLLIGFTKTSMEWVDLWNTDKCRIAHSANCATAIDKLREPGAEYNRIVLRAQLDQLEGASAFVAAVRAMGKHLPIDLVVNGSDLASHGITTPHAFTASRAETRRGLMGRGEVVIEYHAPCRPAGRS